MSFATALPPERLVGGYRSAAIRAGHAAGVEPRRAALIVAGERAREPRAFAVMPSPRAGGGAMVDIVSSVTR